jgi:hypothetical protein
MTLNLLLTCKDAVYLSGDFRLTAIHDQSALPDSYDTQKVIPVIRRDWAALVAYAGLASAPPLVSDMGEWIAEQMDAIPFDGSFSELSRRLLRANLWLGKIRGEGRLPRLLNALRRDPDLVVLNGPGDEVICVRCSA